MRRLLFAALAGLALALVAALTLTAVDSGRTHVSNEDMPQASAAAPAPILPVSNRPLPARHGEPEPGR